MKKTSILIITVFIMAILTACGSSADNSQKQETSQEQSKYLYTYNIIEKRAI